MYITSIYIYYMYIYIYHFVHSVSFVVPRGLGTRVTSSKRKKKERKPLRPSHTYISYLSLRVYVRVRICVSEVSLCIYVSVRTADNLQALGSNSRGRSRFASKFARERYALGNAPPRSLVLRDGCLSKLPRKSRY